MRRRQAPPPATPAGVPADLAAGPCVEIWADPKDPSPIFSARRKWRDARDRWAREHGLHLPGDYRHLPRELRDRAPFYASERNATP